MADIVDKSFLSSRLNRVMGELRVRVERRFEGVRASF